MKRKIATLFKELCCSVCKTDFDEQSVQIMRTEEELIVFKLTCQKCGKTFGVAFLGISDFELKNFDESICEEDMTLKMQEGTNPISTDDVLDAHKFIKNLDKDWPKLLSEMWKNN